MTGARRTPSGLAPPKDHREDPARKWTEFSTAITALLGVSILAVVAAVGAVTSARLDDFARQEHGRKADDMARFLARAAFVPVALEDLPALERAIAVYLDDRDLARVVVADAQGRPLAARDGINPPGGRREISVTRPILPAEEPRSGRSLRPVGMVSITLSLARVDAIVRQSLLWVAGVGLGLLLIAVAVDLALIARMTRRLQELVGEARMAEELRRSNQELEQFAFVASHDLQEPLRKIVAYCQLFERTYRGKLDDKADELIAVIVSGGARMSELIKDLLDYARVGTQGRPFEPTDTAAALRRVLAALEESIRESGAEVLCEGLPTVSSDPTQMGQLLQNLVANAIKFRGDKPPRVRVSARRQGRQWRFCVRDNGIGIDPRYQDRVFDMFKRLNPRSKYPGTGIGLAICKKIVERHGGRIWIESAPGEGAAFYFTWHGGEL